MNVGGSANGSPSISERRTLLLVAVGLGAAVAYLAGLYWGLGALRVAAKPIPVLCLAIWTATQGGAYAAAIAAGLFASLVGDVLLELPGRFLGGLGAFLVAHLCYTAAFCVATRELLLARATPFAAYGVLTFALLQPGLGTLALPVAVYAIAISAMMWRAAACLGRAERRAAAALALGGAVSFALSDTLIAFDRFRSPIAGVRYPIILLYWIGQLGIALSARRAGPAASTA